MSRVPNIAPFVTDDPTAPAQQSIAGASANLNAAADRQTQLAITGAQIRAQAESQKAQIEAAAKAQEAELESRQALEESRQEGFQNLNDARAQENEAQRRFEADQAELQYARLQEQKKQDQMLLEERQAKELMIEEARERRRLAREAGDREAVAAANDEILQIEEEIDAAELTAKAFTTDYDAFIAEGEQTIAEQEKLLDQLAAVEDQRRAEVQVSVADALAQGALEFDVVPVTLFERAGAATADIISKAASPVRGAGAERLSGAPQSALLSPVDAAERNFVRRSVETIAEQGLLSRVGFKNVPSAKGKLEELITAINRRASLDLEGDASEAELTAADAVIAEKGRELTAMDGADEGALSSLLDEYYKAADLSEGYRQRLTDAKVLNSNGKFKEDARGKALQETLLTVARGREHVRKAGFVNTGNVAERARDSFGVLAAAMATGDMELADEYVEKMRGALSRVGYTDPEISAKIERSLNKGLAVISKAAEKKEEITNLEKAVRELTRRQKARENELFRTIGRTRVEAAEAETPLSVELGLGQ